MRTLDIQIDRIAIHRRLQRRAKQLGRHPGAKCAGGHMACFGHRERNPVAVSLTLELLSKGSREINVFGPIARRICVGQIRAQNLLAIRTQPQCGLAKRKRVVIGNWIHAIPCVLTLIMQLSCQQQRSAQFRPNELPSPQTRHQTPTNTTRPDGYKPCRSQSGNNCRSNQFAALIKRPLTGCTGRAFVPTIFRNNAICSDDAVTG